LQAVAAVVIIPQIIVQAVVAQVVIVLSLDFPCLLGQARQLPLAQVAQISFKEIPAQHSAAVLQAAVGVDVTKTKQAMAVQAVVLMGNQEERQAAGTRVVIRLQRVIRAA
jgi:hypothetical protein